MRVFLAISRRCLSLKGAMNTLRVPRTNQGGTDLRGLMLPMWMRVSFRVQLTICIKRGSRQRVGDSVLYDRLATAPATFQAYGGRWVGLWTGFALSTWMTRWRNSKVTAPTAELLKRSAATWEWTESANASVESMRKRFTPYDGATPDKGENGRIRLRAWGDLGKFKTDMQTHADNLDAEVENKETENQSLQSDLSHLRAKLTRLALCRLNRRAAMIDLSRRLRPRHMRRPPIPRPGDLRRP